jgi:hypothetical protein
MVAVDVLLLLMVGVVVAVVVVVVVVVVARASNREISVALSNTGIRAAKSGGTWWR